VIAEQLGRMAQTTKRYMIRNQGLKLGLGQGLDDPKAKGKLP
jgi:hypothetical protein